MSHAVAVFAGATRGDVGFSNGEGDADVCAARADACVVYAAEAMRVAARVRIRHAGRVRPFWGSGDQGAEKGCADRCVIEVVK